MKTNLSKIFKDNKIFSFLLTVLLFGLISGMYSGILNNYLHEVLGMGKTERGLLEFPREMPGLLIFLVMALLYRFSEMDLVKIALVSTLIGMIGFFLKGDVTSIGIAMICFWSIGEHLMMPARKSIAIFYAQPGQEGAALGTLRGYFNGGQAAGYYIGPLIMLILTALGINQAFSRYRVIFFLGIILIIAALIMTFLIKDTHKSQPRKKLFISKKYKKYYLLEIFFGARKQVFLTFAPFVLILKYGASAAYISLLYGVWSIINMFLAPQIGKLLDKIGYKKVLIWDSLALIILCFLYGFSGRLFSNTTAFIITSIVFLLDSISFAMGMARDLYAKSKSDTNEEFTTTLSTGLSMNHLISIIIAIAGGFLWEYMGIEYLFSAAALVGVGSWIISMTLEVPQKKEITEKVTT
ncbi:MAG: MFS transporter [Spirochaetales bacterium]|nr:MFS transporter [Spirochaetales bacterium]